MDPNSGLLPPLSRACSHLAEPCMEGERSPVPREKGRDSPFAWSPGPSSSFADPDWFWDENIQAKRARVETIVQGMCLSPHALALGPGNAGARDGAYCAEKARERKRKQSLPMQQGPLKPGPVRDHGSRKGGPRVREQLHQLKQQLRHLQKHILQAAEPRDAAQDPGGSETDKGPLRVKQRKGCGSRPWAMDSDHYQGSRADLSGEEKHRASEVECQSGEPRFLPCGARALLEILRKELTGAVAQAVDSALQKVLLDPSGHLTQLGSSFQGLVPEGRSEPSPPERGACKDLFPLATLPRRPQPQTGVPLRNLSLAKSLDPPRYPVSLRMIPRPYQGPPANCPLTAPSHIQGNQILGQLLGHRPSGHWSSSLSHDSSSQSLPSSEPALQPWGAVKLRPSVLSQQQYALPFTSPRLERLPLLPSVKMEPGGLQAAPDVLPFPSLHIQEGLNPGHLKKAKLMFFFTRYPSSNLLKAYFPDVQFNRCITSQMIKWFSNFREFYYIQMEKFARQAISDGVTNPKMLVVLRDSELFRALNVHYNKGNDFEVPDCFLEIASLTLQEFFRAVSAGKDSDPSWKKPIYKIISKLDSDIPEIFKSSSYPQELFRN
ncbi:prospero homeobox protein 2 isoform X1 [Ailuropoda melanoleuca]|uniref:prospero homeobox protein 2 isoform X1 n=1 Tax=Ailuropoda melanoleuca TaxID=9646 RepID=UPI0001DE9F24|nr:prospero homeobox protein 2 isoform X1 [Ailuropoda melanoleuca]